MAQPEKVDEQAVKATVGTLRKELGAVFHTNKDKINEVLLGKSKQEIAAIRSEYKEHYGIDLDSELHKHLSGKSLTEAEASLSGDRAQSFAAALHNAGGLVAGKQHIQSMLEQIDAIKDVAERNRIRAQLKEQFSAQYTAAQKADPSDRDAQKLVALIDGDHLAVEALNIDQQLHSGLGGKGGLLGLGLGVNKAAIIESVEKSKDPAERNALLTKYQAHTGQDLKTELAGRLNGTSADLAKAVLSGDADGAAAARIHAATEGFWGTDKEKIFDQLEGNAAGPGGKPLSPAQLKDHQANVIAKYNQQYGKGNPKAFDTLITHEMNGLAADRMHELVDKGQVSDELTLKYAMHGHFFADKGSLKKVLEGKSPAQIDKLEQEYQKAGYGDLKAEIAKSTDQNSLLGGGRDGFEIQQLLKGTPKTPSERLQRAQETFEFERGTGSNAVGRGFMDLVSHSGQDLELQHNRILALQEKIKHNGGHPADGDMQELIKLTGYQSEDVKAYQESKDSAANSAAMGAALVVGTAATIVSGGTAGPATAAVIGSLAGGAASMATKMTIQGSGYSTADLKADLIETGVSALTAGVGQSAGVMRGMDKLLKIGPAGGGLLKETVKGTLLSTASGMVSGVSSQLGNEQNYLGEGAFMEKLASGVGRATLSSALGGGLGAGFGSSSLGRGGFAQNHQLAFAGLSGAVGGLGSGLSGVVTGDGFGLDSLQGVLSGAVSGVGSAHQMMSYHQAQAQQQHGPMRHFAEHGPMPTPLGPERPTLTMPAVTPEQLASWQKAPSHPQPPPEPLRAAPLHAVEGMPHAPPSPESAFGTTQGAKTSAQAGETDFRQAANPEHVQQRARGQIEQLPVEQQQHIRGLIQGAENHAQLVMLERAVAAGHSVSEVTQLFSSMRGMSEAETLRGFTGSGIFQYFSHSCVPTSFQIAIAEMDPVFALQLRENPTAAAKQQNKHLTEAHGVAQQRTDQTFQQSPEMQEHLFRNSETENLISSVTKKNENGQPIEGQGIYPDKMQGTELHQLLERASGHKYELYASDNWIQAMPGAKGSFPSGTFDHARIQETLNRGLPIPFAQNSHEQVITGVNRNSDGSVHYVVSDPWTGKGTLIPQSSFDGVQGGALALHLPNLESGKGPDKVASGMAPSEQAKRAEESKQRNKAAAIPQEELAKLRTELAAHEATVQSQSRPDQPQQPAESKALQSPAQASPTQSVTQIDPQRAAALATTLAEQPTDITQRIEDSKRRNRPAAFSAQEIAQLRAMAEVELAAPQAVLADPAAARSIEESKQRNQAIVFSPEDVAKIRASVEQDRTDSSPLSAQSRGEQTPGNIVVKSAAETPPHVQLAAPESTQGVPLGDAIQHAEKTGPAKGNLPQTEPVAKSDAQAGPQLSKSPAPGVGAHQSSVEQGVTALGGDFGYGVEKMAKLQEAILAPKDSGSLIDPDVSEHVLDKTRGRIARLSPEEMLALQRYTTEDYKTVNAVLRDRQVPDGAAGHNDPKIAEKVQGMIQAAKEGLAKLPNYQSADGDSTVYRGTGMSERLFESYIKAYQSGGTVSDAAFSSSSYKQDIAVDFMRKEGGEGKVPVMCTIKSKSGKAVEFLSRSAYEAEVMFGPGTKFKVLEIADEAHIGDNGEKLRYKHVEMVEVD